MFVNICPGHTAQMGISPYFYRYGVPVIERLCVVGAICLPEQQVTNILDAPVPPQNLSVALPDTGSHKGLNCAIIMQPPSSYPFYFQIELMDGSLRRNIITALWLWRGTAIGPRLLQCRNPCPFYFQIELMNGSLRRNIITALWLSRGTAIGPRLLQSRNRHCGP